MYIPQGTMPGELVQEKSYNTSRKRMVETTENTEFNEKFGRGRNMYAVQAFGVQLRAEIPE